MAIWIPYRGYLAYFGSYLKSDAVRGSDLWLKLNRELNQS